MTTAPALRTRIHTIHVRARLPLSRLAARAASAAGLTHSPTAPHALLITDVASPAIAEEWMVESVPHTVVALRAGGVRVGPFIVPGSSPCLRCVQVTQQAEPSVLDPADPSELPTEVSAGLLVAGIGLAARDLATYSRGLRPWGWATTITLGDEVYVEEWPRHPHCGCAWGLAG